MKDLTIIVLTASILLGNIEIAHATPIAFTPSTIDFYGSGTDPNDQSITYLKIIDAFQYTHKLEGLNLAPQSLVTAFFSITHEKNSNNSGEVWLSSSLGNISIGQLSNSGGSTWVTDTFDLTSISGLFAEMVSTSPWSLTIKLADGTTGVDKIYLDKSVLYGTYEPVAESSGERAVIALAAVPEPSGFYLLGLGLLGLLSRRKIFKTRV